MHVFTLHLRLARYSSAFWRRGAATAAHFFFLASSAAITELEKAEDSSKKMRGVCREVLMRKGDHNNSLKGNSGRQ